MKSRNLELSSEKTSITRIDEGFDFLGFNIRQHKGKTLIKPSRDSILSLCKEIAKTITSLNGATQEALISKLNPILRGFANYYRNGVSKEAFRYIHHRVWQYLWRWAKRRHPKKSAAWVKKAYFHNRGERNWVFGCYTKNRRGDSKFIELFNVPSTPIIRHIKVKGNASPDDASLKEYWKNAIRQQENSNGQKAPNTTW